MSGTVKTLVLILAAVLVLLHPLAALAATAAGVGALAVLVTRSARRAGIRLYLSTAQGMP